VAAEAEHQRRIHNWTVRDKQGREWGLGEGGVPIVAGHRLPTRVAPPIHVDRDREESERAQARQQRLARQPAGALTATKKLMRNGEALVAQMQAEGEQFARRLRTAEAREAFTAFAERRPPDFTKVV